MLCKDLTDEQKEILINEVKLRPILYDKRQPNYKLIDVRNANWDAVGAIMNWTNADRGNCAKKIFAAVRKYFNSLRRTKSGQAANLKDYAFFESMSFIIQRSAPSKSASFLDEKLEDSINCSGQELVIESLGINNGEVVFENSFDEDDELFNFVPEALEVEPALSYEADKSFNQVFDESFSINSVPEKRKPLTSRKSNKINSPKVKNTQFFEEVLEVEPALSYEADKSFNQVFDESFSINSVPEKRKPLTSRKSNKINSPKVKNTQQILQKIDAIISEPEKLDDENDLLVRILKRKMDKAPRSASKDIRRCVYNCIDKIEDLIENEY